MNAKRFVASLALLASISSAAIADRGTSDPLAAIDMNRSTIVGDIVRSFDEDFAKLSPAERMQEAGSLAKRLSGLRADRLLAASLASNRDSLEAILAEAEKSREAAVHRTSAKSLGSATTDLVYTPLTPCRLVDTRGFGAPIQGGPFVGGARRNYVPQGLCGLPTANVASILISFTTQNLTPNSGGYLAIMAPNAPVTASVDVFNLGSEWSASNTAVSTGSASQFDVLVAVASAHVVIDVLGYFAPPQGGAVTGVTASAPLVSSGGAVPNISLAGTLPVANGGTGQATLAANGVIFGQGAAAVGTAVGTVGQVLIGNAGAPPSWSGSPALSGNLSLAPSSASVGNILKGATRFLHDTGTNNTFAGSSAGNHTLSGTDNVGVGFSVLAAVAGGSNNVGVGSNALKQVTTGVQNVAVGQSAMDSNTAGCCNTAVGNSALANGSNGSFNVVMGAGAGLGQTMGDFNTIIGTNSFGSTTTAFQNTGIGGAVLGSLTSGNGNTALGYNAGSSITTGAFNIDIGNTGVAGDTGTIRIGNFLQNRAFIAGIRGVTTAAAAIPVLIDTNGQLGTTSSSRRFKDDIADMDAASNALMKLRPVTFHYKADKESSGASLQYGLIAEEVAEVYPDLVAHSADGQVETVMYQYLPPMLLNEFQKQQRVIESLAAEVAALKRTIAGGVRAR